MEVSRLIGNAYTRNQCKKTCQFKTWCKGDKSNIENSTDHFCEDTRQNALAHLTNLGHVTPFLLDSKLPYQTEVHIRTGLSSDPLAEEIVLILVALYSHSGAADAVAEKPSSMISFLKNRHSLGKKTVVQLRPKFRTGSSFFTGIYLILL